MGRFVRKNLVVDGEKVSELARRRGTNESEAVRQAVDYALTAELYAGTRLREEARLVDRIMSVMQRAGRLIVPTPTEADS